MLIVTIMLSLLLSPSVAPDTAPPAAWRIRGAMIAPGMPWQVAEALLDGDIVGVGRALASGTTYVFVKSGVRLVRGVDHEGREVVKSVAPIFK